MEAQEAHPVIPPVLEAHPVTLQAQEAHLAIPQALAHLHQEDHFLE